MGLDMYLTAQISLADYEFSPTERETAKRVYAALGVDRNLLERSGTVGIELPVGYWRKANAIHAWFVANVQGGVDDCEEAYVSKEALDDIEQVCRRVMDDHDLAPSLLPAQRGFFFGSTEYDEHYFSNVAATLAIIERAKALKENLPFATMCYRSSW